MKYKWSIVILFCCSTTGIFAQGVWISQLNREYLTTSTQYDFKGFQIEGGSLYGGLDADDFGYRFSSSAIAMQVAPKKYPIIMGLQTQMLDFGNGVRNVQLRPYVSYVKRVNDFSMGYGNSFFINYQENTWWNFRTISFYFIPTLDFGYKDIHIGGFIRSAEIQDLLSGRGSFSLPLIVGQIYYHIHVGQKLVFTPKISLDFAESRVYTGDWVNNGILYAGVNTKIGSLLTLDLYFDGAYSTEEEGIVLNIQSRLYDSFYLNVGGSYNPDIEKLKTLNIGIKAVISGLNKS